MIDILKAILFGIIEGITEWLPVSSTGHMILLEEFVKLNVSKAFWDMFLVVIQLGAIMAVVVIYFKRLWPFQTKPRFSIPQDKLHMWLKILLACLPAAIIGLLFDEKIDELFYHYVPVAIALIVFGIGFLIVERRNQAQTVRVDRIADITYRDALIIGLFQVLAAVFPGTSRSGATILGGIMIGLSRTTAAEFTFFLAVPVMMGASLLKMIKFGLAFSGLEVVILAVGMVTAFVVSVVAIKFLLGYIKKHNFNLFGYYRIILGLIVLMYAIGR